MRRSTEYLAVLFAVCLGASAQSRQAEATNPSYPREVAAVKRIHVAGENPVTIPLFTPQATGLYRVSVFVLVTTPAGAGTYKVSVDFTDNNGLDNQEIFSVAEFERSSRSSVVVVNDIGGQTISLSIVPFGEPTGGYYDVYATVEKLRQG